MHEGIDSGHLRGCTWQRRGISSNSIGGMVVQNSKGSQSVGRKEISTSSLTLSLEESGDGDDNSSPRVGLKLAHVTSPFPKIKC